VKKREKQKKQEKSCKHQWAEVLAKRGNKIISVPSAKICLKCGLFKVGTHTIKMSRFRLNMGNLPIEDVKKVIIDNSGGRLKVPVGTDLFD